MRWVVAVLASGALCMGVPALQDEEKRWFVDETFLFERGSALSREYLQAKAPEFARTLEQLLPWAARIEIRHSNTESGYSSNHGSGIVLSGGRVLTAGHVLTQNVSGGISRILLTLADGTVVGCEVERQGEGDWALLRVLKEEGQEALFNSPLELGSATAGEITVFIGYTARLGLDGEGRVQSFHNGDVATGLPVSQLAPMLVVSTVLDEEAMTLEPLAGFPPVGGMSGGPILNSRGQVIGVQTSVSKTTEDATGKVLHYRINAEPVGDVPR